jgi:hypothetical protein
MAFVNVSLSRNVLNIELVKYDGNEESAGKLRLNTAARETENKARFDVSQTLGGWKVSYGTSVQYVEYFNNSFIRRRAAIRDTAGNLVQPEDIFRYNTAIAFWRYGLYAQVGKRIFGDRLNLSAGIRGDANSFLTGDKKPFGEFVATCSSQLPPCAKMDHQCLCRNLYKAAALYGDWFSGEQFIC